MRFIIQMIIIKKVKIAFFSPFQHVIAFKEQPFVSSAAARTITKKAIRHQQNCIIAMMSSAVAISIFHYFPSLLFFDVKYTSPLSTQRSLLFKCSPFQKSRMLTPPNRARSPRHSRLFTIWLAMNINHFTFIFNTCVRNWASCGRFLRE